MLFLAQEKIQQQQLQQKCVNHESVMNFVTKLDMIRYEQNMTFVSVYLSFKQWLHMIGRKMLSVKFCEKF